MKHPVQQPFRMTSTVVITAMHGLVYCAMLGCNDLLGIDRQWNGPDDRSNLEQDASFSSKVTDGSSAINATTSSKPSSTGTNSSSSGSSNDDRAETSNGESDADTVTPTVGTDTDTSSKITNTDASSDNTDSDASIESTDSDASIESTDAGKATAITDDPNPSSSGTSTNGTTSNSSTNDDSDGATCPAPECAVDDVICVLGARQTCDLDEDGCLMWSEPETCAWELCEDETTCLDCSEGGVGCPPCEGESCHIPVGQPCVEGDTCVAGRCQQTSDGSAICCTASCDSACLACAQNGQSCVSLADDATCGTVTCPPDNPCRNYTAESVTDNRCVDGTCGAPEEVCPYVVRNDGEECSETHLCDTMGNCSVPKLALGAECELDSACTSDHCVDGVCCENECDGVCMECRVGTGRCDVTPLDDVECDDVDCSRWNADCTRAAGNITADHCAAFGQCKSELSCTIENRPRGTGCPGHMLYVCDGEGECGFPTVECGQTTCLPETNGGGISAGCCHHDPNFDLSPLECRPRDECIQQYGDWSVECDEQADCRSGELVCCGIGVNGMGWVACAVPEDCNIFSSPVGTAELCQSPAMGAVDCSNGGACLIEVDSLPGFRFCTSTEASE